MMSGSKGRLLAYIGEDDGLFLNDTFPLSLRDDVLKSAKEDKDLKFNIRKMFHVKPTEAIIFDVVIDDYYKLYEGSLINSYTGDAIYPEAKILRSLLNQTAYLMFRSTVVKTEWGGRVVTITSERKGNTFLLKGGATFIVKK